MTLKQKTKLLHVLETLKSDIISDKTKDELMVSIRNLITELNDYLIYEVNKLDKKYSKQNGLEEDE